MPLESTALAVGAGGGCLDFFSHAYLFSSFSLPLSERRPDNRLKYYLKGLLKTNILVY